MARVMPGVRRTVVIEPNPTGHRLFYARLIAEAARQRGDHVTLVLGEHPEAEEERVHLSGLQEGIAVRRGPASGLDDLVRASHVMHSDSVIVPDGDRTAISLALRRKWEGSGELSVLVMRETAQPASNALITRMKTALRTMAFRRAAAMGRVRLRVLKSPTWSGHSAFGVAVDPIRTLATPSTVEAFRSAHRITGDRYWFAVLGAISTRKNLELILDAIVGLDTNVGLLVAGKLDQDIPLEIRHRLATLEAEGRVVVVDRLLSDVELDSAVASVDCVVLAHSNEGPSGLLGKAAAIGTRIVAAGAKSLKNDLAAYPALGEWVALDTHTLAEALHRAASSPRPPAVLKASSEAFTSALLP